MHTIFFIFVHFSGMFEFFLPPDSQYLACIDCRHSLPLDKNSSIISIILNSLQQIGINLFEKNVKCSLLSFELKETFSLLTLLPLW